MTVAIKQFVFEHQGRNFVARVFADETMGAPWEEHDGHGAVREVRCRGARNAGKRPGERVLHSNGHTVWLYDWEAACKLARKDGWNAAPYDAPGRVERAVQADFDRLKAWLSDNWEWIGVGVAPCAPNGEFPDDDGAYYTHALWGIESGSPDYLNEVAKELAASVTMGDE